MSGQIASFARLALLVLALPLGGCGASSLASTGPMRHLHDEGLGPLPHDPLAARDDSFEPSRLRELDHSPAEQRKVVTVASSGRLSIQANDCPACRVNVR